MGALPVPLTKDGRVRDILLGMRSGNEGWWPGLSDADGRRATKIQANKFMLGAIMDYQMPADAVWENARILSEDLLGDPDDLWGTMARMPGDELAGCSAARRRCTGLSTECPRGCKGSPTTSCASTVGMREKYGKDSPPTR